MLLIDVANQWKRTDTADGPTQVADKNRRRTKTDTYKVTEAPDTSIVSGLRVAYEDQVR
ncbi:MAG: hypothetical protein ACR2N1_12305 [Rubripirellula sp.]